MRLKFKDKEYDLTCEIRESPFYSNGEWEIELTAQNGEDKFYGIDDISFDRAFMRLMDGLIDRE